MINKEFKVESEYEPSGDQSQAIEALAKGLDQGKRYQTLKGVTGSGKTFTMAKLIEKVQRPTLVLSHNKTLAAQLFREFKTFFPNNAVEYFVSTYDFYQPEAYVPGKDLYIEKEAEINQEIDRMRMSASFSLLERNDVIVVSTVSCIFSLANPSSITELMHTIKVGETFNHREEIAQLIRMQYVRNDYVLKSGCFRIKGDTIEICPPYIEEGIRISIDWDEIEKIEWFDLITGKSLSEEKSVKIYPAKQFVMPKKDVLAALGSIQQEMQDQYELFINTGRPLEAERIKTRVEYDLEMLRELGYCTGIENYSRLLGKRAPGERPAVLLDYFPDDFITFIDESHVTLPQIGAMYNGDHSRKLSLVKYGFRLPSALDNRPLTGEEFNEVDGQRIFVSATPGKLEKQYSQGLVEQIIRPTGLLDPEIEVLPTEGQMEDLYGKIVENNKKGYRTLVTTLTKRMSEDLTSFFASQGLKVRYLHSEIDTIERVDILRDLRLGKFDVLIGINLLREGLDLPEVALVAILDADKIGFLRSETSLIQTIGRAARNADGKVIMYADKISDAMDSAIKETERRRQKQMEYNLAHGITPTTIVKAVQDIIEKEEKAKADDRKTEFDIRSSRYDLLSGKDRKKYLKELEREMISAAKNLEFERAASIRDEISRINVQYEQ